jgi:glycosyltransferase involved in cell wall biosynthesis
MDKKLRVAWFSPLSDCNTESIALYFTQQLLPIIKDEIEVEIFHPHVSNVQTCDSISDSTKCHHFVRAVSEHSKRPFDLFFYQVEDHPSAFFSRYHLGVMPGLVLFHNYRLRTPTPPALRHSPFKEVIEMFRGKVERLPEERVWPENNCPIATRELSLAVGALFSQVRAVEEYQHFSHPRLIDSPFSAFLPTPVTTSASASRIKSPEAPLLVGLCSDVGREGRAYKVLSALKSVTDIRLIWLLDSKEIGAAQDLIADYGVANRVELRGGRSPISWQQLILEIDLAIHLHFGWYSTATPYLGISLAHGVPVVASDLGEGPYLSEDAAFSIRPGDREAQELAEVFRGFKGGFGTMHGDSAYQKRGVAEELLLAFEIVARDVASVMPRWRSLRSCAWREISESLATCGVYNTLSPRSL